MKTFICVLPAMLTFVLAGCASQADTGSQSEVASTTGATQTGSTAALDVLRGGGTFAFALRESDPSAVIHAQCTQQEAGDAARVDACYARVLNVANREGIRFSTDTEGRVVWTSFGADESGAAHEEVYIQVPLALTADGARFVNATPATAASGTRLPSTTPGAMRFEVVDNDTVVMTDSRKGRLVFHRSAAR